MGDELLASCSAFHYLCENNKDVKDHFLYLKKRQVTAINLKISKMQFIHCSSEVVLLSFCFKTSILLEFFFGKCSPI